MRALLLAALLLPAAALAQADIEPGNWEITATTQMDGVPKPIAILRTECLAADAARDPGRLLNPGTGSCEFSNRRQGSGGYSFDVSCGGALPMRGTGRVSYSGQTLDARLELATELQGRRVGMNSRISGRRLGACAR